MLGFDAIGRAPIGGFDLPAGPAADPVYVVKPCPNFFASFLATLALLPRGPAWPANDGGHLASRFLHWLHMLAAPPAATDWPTGYVQAGFFAAIATVRNFVENRLCDLRQEWWCATHNETHDLWLLEYGLPDACDPFPDLCSKVAASGGSDCAYLIAVAAHAGWKVACAGDSTLTITIDTGNSPSFVGATQTPPLMGRLLCGQVLACGPSVGSLRCLLDRIIPAHMPVVYATI